MKNENLNILWISDIHIKENYFNGKMKKVKNSINEYISVMCDLIKNINKKEKITHVIFTGDITHDGKVKEFEYFKEFILNPIKQVLNNPSPNKNNPVFMFVPGNHEVIWEMAKKIFIEHHFKDEKNKIFYRKIKNADDIKKYRKCFAIKELQGEFRKRDEDDELKFDYNFFYGYYYDKTYNCVFLLLNSCFYSFGNIPQAYIKSQLTDFVPEERVESTFSKIFPHEKIIYQEYGNQTYALNLFKEWWEDIDKYINEGAYVISMSHHSMDWLHISERLTDAHSNTADINSLTSRSKLHLSGHDHGFIPISKYDNCNILRSGLFIDKRIEDIDDKPNNKNFPNNWFSIISKKENKISCTPYYYLFESLKWKFKKYEIPYKIEPEFHCNIIKENNSRLSDKCVKNFLKQRYGSSRFKNEMYAHNSINFLIFNNELYTSLIFNSYWDFINLKSKQIKSELFSIIDLSIKNKINTQRIEVTFLDFYSIQTNKKPFECKTIFKDHINDKIGELKLSEQIKFDVFKYHVYEHILTNKVNISPEIVFLHEILFPEIQ